MNRKEKRRIYFGPCPWESGKKYKNCCLPRDMEERKKRMSKTKEGEKNV